MIIAAFKNSGIDKIEGNLYLDLSSSDSLFWGKGWMWDDDSSRDFPYMNSLPINKNSIKVVISPSTAGEKPLVTTIPPTEFVHIINKAVTVERDTTKLLVTRDWINRNNDITVSGFTGAASLPDTLETNIVNPDKYFLALFTEQLKKGGIEFSGKTDTLKTPAGLEPVASVKRPIEKVINRANKESDNLNAEMLLRCTAYEMLKRKISAEDGVKYTDSLITLAGLKGSNYRIVDGSGLSFYNLISTRLLTEVLKYIYSKPKLYNVILPSLPSAGIDGTMAGRLKEFAHLNNINLKTGSLSGVSALAGYITSEHGHTLAVSVLIQNFKGNQAPVREIMDEICRAAFLIKSEKDE